MLPFFGIGILCISSHWKQKHIVLLILLILISGTMQLVLMVHHNNTMQDKYVIAVKNSEEQKLRSKISKESLETKLALEQNKMNQKKASFNLFSKKMKQLQSATKPDLFATKPSLFATKPGLFGDIIDPLAPRAKVTFMVLSARSHFNLRDAIRTSWAKNKKNFFFVVGGLPCKIPPNYRSKFKMENHHCEPGPDPVPKNIYHAYQIEINNEQRGLELEAKAHSDLFLAPMMDTYGGLPRKVKEALRYCLTVNHGSDWCMKVDDDMIVRTEKIERALSAYDNQKNMIVGRVRRNVGVPKGGKWADHEYTKPQYPPFCNGDGWIVPHHLAQLIVDHDGFEYQGEDVSMGIWLDELTKEFNLWQTMFQLEMLVKVYQSFPVDKKRSSILSRLIKEEAKARRAEETYWQTKNLNPKLFHNHPNDESDYYSHLNHEKFAMHIKLEHSSYTKYHYASSLMEEKNEVAWNINKKKRMYQHFQNIQSGTMFGLERNPTAMQVNQNRKQLFDSFLKQAIETINSTSYFLNKEVVANFLEDNIQLPIFNSKTQATNHHLHHKSIFQRRRANTLLNTRVQTSKDHHVSSSIEDKKDKKEMVQDSRLLHKNLKHQYNKIEITNQSKVQLLPKVDTFQQQIRNNLESWMAKFLSSQIQSKPWHVTWTETTAFAQFQGDRNVDCSNKKFLIIGHNLSPGLIKSCGTICAPGKSTRGAGTKTACAECDVGQYAEEDGSQLCTKCEVGKANPFKGSSNSSDCVTCSIGTYSRETGAGVCSSCSAGKFSDSSTIEKVQMCKNCSRGYYNGQVGRTTCSKCETGMYSTETTAATTPCENCMVGRYEEYSSTEMGKKLSCKSCSIGMYCHMLHFFS